MRRFIILGLVAVIALVVADGLALRRDNAEAYHNNQIQVGDIDDNGYINFTGDVIALARIAFGLQPPPAPYVIPTPPTIVGNRAFHSAYLAAPPQLINTDDGSVVATFAVGDALGGNPLSCDGAYAMITSPVVGGVLTTARIISTRDGSTVASDPANYNSPYALFTCPLKGIGAQFSTGAPVANRAIVRGLDDSNVAQLRIFDLTTGQMLYAKATPYSPVMSCNQSTIVVTTPPGLTEDVVRLSDGAVVATISNTSPVMTC